jgi:hypothetical protein
MHSGIMAIHCGKIPYIDFSKFPEPLSIPELKFLKVRPFTVRTILSRVFHPSKSLRICCYDS